MWFQFNGEGSNWSDISVDIISVCFVCLYNKHNRVQCTQWSVLWLNSKKILLMSGYGSVTLWNLGNNCLLGRPVLAPLPPSDAGAGKLLGDFCFTIVQLLCIHFNIQPLLFGCCDILQLHNFIMPQQFPSNSMACLDFTSKIYVSISHSVKFFLFILQSDFSIFPGNELEWQAGVSFLKYVATVRMYLFKTFAHLTVFPNPETCDY